MCCLHCVVCACTVHLGFLNSIFYRKNTSSQTECFISIFLSLKVKKKKLFHRRFSNLSHSKSPGGTNDLKLNNWLKSCLTSLSGWKRRVCFTSDLTQHLWSAGSESCSVGSITSPNSDVTEHRHSMEYTSTSLQQGEKLNHWWSAKKLGFSAKAWIQFVTTWIWFL